MAFAYVVVTNHYDIEKRLPENEEQYEMNGFLLGVTVVDNRLENAEPSVIWARSEPTQALEQTEKALIKVSESIDIFVSEQIYL